MTATNEETIPMRRWELDIVRPPMYDISFWNVHQEALNALARTNNSMEATHRQFQVCNNQKKINEKLNLLEGIDASSGIVRFSAGIPK